MTWRAESSQLIAGRWVAGDRGLGVDGFTVPATGVDGASFLYNDLGFPGDELVEIRGHVLTVPSAGTFFAYEDGSFELLDAPDGVYQFTYRLYVNGADLGVATVEIYVGVQPGTSSGVVSGVGSLVAEGLTGPVPVPPAAPTVTGGGGPGGTTKEERPAWRVPSRSQTSATPPVPTTTEVVRRVDVDVDAIVGKAVALVTAQKDAETEALRRAVKDMEQRVVITELLRLNVPVAPRKVAVRAMLMPEPGRTLVIRRDAAGQVVRVIVNSGDGDAV